MDQDRSADGTATRTWLESLGVYLQRPVVTMLFLGFSAGLPILLVFGTLSIWLREAGIERTTIGFFSWVALSYGLKFLWAPLIDQIRLPLLARLLGRRRSWLLVAQLAIMLCIAGMALSDPSLDARQMAFFAFLLAFCGATQDIVIDAYRIEAADLDVQAAMTSTYQLGYRLAMIFAGAGALEIAGAIDVIEGYSYEAWQATYFIMAGAMGIGIATTFLAREPKTQIAEGPSFENGFTIKAGSEWLYRAVVAPFIDFFSRFGWIALAILCLIALYRLTDVVMGIMAGPFYVDLGFAKEEIGRYSKFFGIWMTIAGAFIGGVLAIRFGVVRVLFLGGLTAAATNLIFAYMATQDKSVALLIAAIIADNLSAGIAGTAFIAYLSGLTSANYTATQYALFSSIMLLFPKFVAGFSGLMVDAMGYAPFFILTAIMGIPALLLIILLERLNVSDRMREPDAGAPGVNDPSPAE
ncbi:MAG: AmpG family muropeptide MFS transporter [Pseudomonadota bacterium]